MDVFKYMRFRVIDSHSPFLLMPLPTVRAYSCVIHYPLLTIYTGPERGPKIGRSLVRGCQDTPKSSVQDLRFGDSWKVLGIRGAIHAPVRRFLHGVPQVSLVVLVGVCGVCGVCGNNGVLCLVT